MKYINNSIPKFSDSFHADGKVLKSSDSQPLVISYIRWSTAVQGDGDSYRRQKHLADEWCRKHNLTITPEHQLLDAGLSAFTGKNVSDGALGAFLQVVQAGKIPEGSILLVENLDRLSRAHPMVAMSILHSIVEAGIVIVTLGSNEKEYRKPLSMGDMFQAIIDLSNAHIESDKKRFRTTQNWQRKHGDLLASNLPMTGNCPAWLKLSADKKTWTKDEKKVERIQQMFDWCISGLGLPAIAKRLNEQKVMPWAKEKRKTGTARMWTIASVNYLLTSRAVFGEFESKRLKKTYPDYFPVIVSKDDFHRAQTAKLTRLKAGRGRKGTTYTNLFGERAYCHDCDEPMTIRHPKRGRATQFYCKGTICGTCNHRPWNYNVFEESFLSLVNELDMESIIKGGNGSRLDTITKELQSLEGHKRDKERTLKTFLDMIRQNPTLAESVTSAMVSVQAELDAIKEQVRALEKELAQINMERSASTEAHRITFPSVEEIGVSKLYELRAAAAQHIKSTVSHISLKRVEQGSLVFSHYTVRFARGGERTVFVNYSDPRKPFAVSGNPTDVSDWVQNDRTLGMMLGGNVKGMQFAEQKE